MEEKEKTMEATNLDEIREFATLCSESKTATVSESELSTQLLRISQYLLVEWKELSTELQTDLQNSMRQILSFAVSELEKSFPRPQEELVERMISCYVQMDLVDELLILVARIVGGSPAKYSLLQRLSYLRLLDGYVATVDDEDKVELIRTPTESLSRLIETTVVETETGKFQVRVEAAQLGGSILFILRCFNTISLKWNSDFHRRSAEVTQDLDDSMPKVLPHLKRMYQQIGALSRYYFDLIIALTQLPSDEDEGQSTMYAPLLSFGASIFSVLNSIHRRLADHPEFQDVSHVATEFLEEGLRIGSSSRSSGQIYLITLFIDSFFDSIKQDGTALSFPRRCFRRLSLWLDMLEPDAGALFVELFILPKDEMGWRANAKGNSHLPTIQAILEALLRSEELHIDDQRINVGKRFTPKVLTQTYGDLFSLVLKQDAYDEELAETITKWATSGLTSPLWFTRFCAVLFFYQSAPQKLISRLSTTLEELLREETSSAVLLAAATFGNTLGGEEDIVKNFRRCKECAGITRCYGSAALIFGERILQISDEEPDCALESSSDLLNSNLLREILEFGGQSRPSWLFKNSTCAMLVLSSPSLRSSLHQVLDSLVAQDILVSHAESEEIELFITGFARYALSAKAFEEDLSLQQKLTCLLRHVIDSLLSIPLYPRLRHRIQTLMPALTILLMQQTHPGLVVEIAGHLKLLFMKPLARCQHGSHNKEFLYAFYGMADAFLFCDTTSQLLSLPEIFKFLRVISSFATSFDPTEKIGLLLNLQRRALVLLPRGTRLPSGDLFLRSHAARYYTTDCRMEIMQKRHAMSQVSEMKGDEKQSIFGQCIGLYWEALNRCSVDDVSHFFASQMFRCLTHPSQNELKQILPLDQSLLEAVLELELERLQNLPICIDKALQLERCALYSAMVLSRPSSDWALELLLSVLSALAKFSLKDDHLKHVRESQDISFGLSYMDFWHQTFVFFDSIMQRIPAFGGEDTESSYFSSNEDDTESNNSSSGGINQRDEIGDEDVGSTEDARSDVTSDESVEDETFGDLVRLVATGFLRFLDQMLIPISFSSHDDHHLDDFNISSIGPCPHSKYSNLSLPQQIADPTDGYATKLVQCCSFCLSLLAEYCVENPTDRLRESVDRICAELSNKRHHLQFQPMWSRATPVLQEMQRELNSYNNDDDESSCIDDAADQTPLDKDEDDCCRKRLEKHQHSADAEEEPAQRRRRHE